MDWIRRRSAVLHQPGRGYIGRKRSGVRKARSAARLGRLMAARSVRPGGYGRGSRGELKVKDTLIDSDINTVGDMILLNGIARGDDISERVGRQVDLVSVNFDGTVYGNATTVNQNIRWAIVYDRFPNGVAPTIPLIYTSISDPSSPRVLDNRNRFTVLASKHMTVSAPGGIHDQMVVKKYRGLHGLQTTFNSGDAGTVADIQSGALYLLMHGTVNDGATECSCYGNVRVRFRDM